MNALHVGVAALMAASALACSPAPDPIGKGNAHFQIGYPSPDVGTCGLPSIGGIGKPPPDLPGGPGQIANEGNKVTDGEAVGEGSYEVVCKVTKGGSIEIDMLGSNDSPSAPLSSGEVTVTVRGSIDGDGAGVGRVTVKTTESGSTTGASCQMTAVQHDGDFQVSAGSAAFTFECPEATPGYDEFSVCKTTGSIVVTDCVKE